MRGAGWRRDYEELAAVGVGTARKSIVRHDKGLDVGVGLRLDEIWADLLTLS